MPWKPSSEALRGQAARNVSAVRKAFMEVTAKHVAEQCEVAPSTLADFNEAIERVCLIAAAAGLKLVPVTDKTMSPEELRYLLRQTIRHAERDLAELGDTRPADL